MGGAGSLSEDSLTLADSWTVAPTPGRCLRWRWRSRRRAEPGAVSSSPSGVDTARSGGPVRLLRLQALVAGSSGSQEPGRGESYVPPACTAHVSSC